MTDQYSWIFWSIYDTGSLGMLSFFSGLEPILGGLEPVLGGVVPNLGGLVEYMPRGRSASSMDMLRFRSWMFSV